MRKMGEQSEGDLACDWGLRAGPRELVVLGSNLDSLLCGCEPVTRPLWCQSPLQ